VFRPDLFHDKKATHGDCQSPKRINWQAGACNTYPEDELGGAPLRRHLDGVPPGGHIHGACSIPLPGPATATRRRPRRTSSTIRPGENGNDGGGGDGAVKQAKLRAARGPP